MKSFKFGFFEALDTTKMVLMTLIYIFFGIASVFVLFIIAVLMVIASRFNYEWR